MLVCHRTVMMTKRVKTSLVASRRISKSLSRWPAWASLKLDPMSRKRRSTFSSLKLCSHARITNGIQVEVGSVSSDHVRKVLLSSRSYLSNSESNEVTLFI